MNNTAIKVSHLTKVYKLYDKPVDRLKESLHPLKKKYHKEFYALNDVSFEIKKGETVGIIGKNGAGKSTLLKIITGILNSSSGHIHVNGRIASILELGAGFNPEYTGIENIYLQGILTGYSREEMKQKIDEILVFAAIGDFIHQPVKMYSSGMLARLAFSISININADILIVDEALSVGDMVFQAKCMAKMTSLMENGVTVLFVSHDTHSVKTLCKKAVFIHEGKVLASGDVGSVVDKYIEMNHCELADSLKEIEVSSKEQTSLDLFEDLTIPTVVQQNNNIQLTEIMQRYGDDRAHILDVRILDKNFKETNELISKEIYIVQISVLFREDFYTFVPAVGLSSLDGVQQLAWISSQDAQVLPSVEKNRVYVINIKINIPIKAGIYNLSIAIELPTIYNQQHQFLDVIKNVKTVKINFKNSEDQFHSVFYSEGSYTLKKLPMEEQQ